MPRKGTAFPTEPDVLAAYEKMIGAVPGVELKGATTPYTSVNGHMFSSISKASRVGLRLSKADREAFIEQYQATLFEALPGFFQKEYVAIPPSMLGDTRTLRRWFRKSYAYVNSLKPKKTTRR